MPQYGGFWIRFVAYFIDSIILNIAIYATLFILMGVGYGVESTGSEGGEVLAAMGGAVGIVASLIGPWLYSAIMESSSWQATLGKKALGLVVTDDSGGRIGFGRATGRYFAKIISSLILLFGFFMIGWTQRKQGLHDMIAGTLVYRGNPQDITTSAAVFE